MMPMAAPPSGGGREAVVIGAIHVDVQAAQHLEHLQDEVDVRLLDAEMETGLARGEPLARLAVFALGALPTDIKPSAGADLLENEFVPEYARGHGEAVDLLVEVVHRQAGDECLGVTMAQAGGPLAKLGQNPRGGGLFVPAHGHPLCTGLFDGDEPEARTRLHRVVGDDVERAVLAQDGFQLSGKVTPHIQEIGDLFAVEAGVREILVFGRQKLADDEDVARHILGPVRMEIPVRQEIMFEKGADDLADRVLLHAIEVFEQAADLFLFQFTFPPAAGFDGLDFQLHGSPYYLKRLD